MARLEGKAPDGKGSVNEQFVDAEGRAGTRALSQTDQEHAVDEETAFILYSTDDAGAGEETWYLKNTGRQLHLARIEISTAASGVFTIMHQTSASAAGGSELVGRNAKLGAANLDDISAFGNASVTGSLDGDAIVGHDIGTTAPYVFELDDLAIPQGQAIFVRTATAGIVHITGFVHYEGG